MTGINHHQGEDHKALVQPHLIRGVILFLNPQDALHKRKTL